MKVHVRFWSDVLLRKLYVSSWNERTVVAAVENGKVMALTICHDGEETVGSMYKGIVKAKKTNIDAYFIDIGREKDVFLHAMDCLESNLQIGEEVVVQTMKESSRHKSGQATMKLSLVGEYIIYSPYTNYVAASKKLSTFERKQWIEFGTDAKRGQEGFIFRTAVSKASRDEVEKELYDLRDQMHQIVEKSKQIEAPALLHRGKDCIEQTVNRYNSTGFSFITTDREDVYAHLTDHMQLEVIFETVPPIDLHKEIQRALKKVVWLQDGSYLLIEENESLTVIDVNSGHSSLDPVTINLNAAHEAIRQLRLRNLSGMIVIDFLRMDEDERTWIQKAVEDAVTRDVHTVTIFGFTRMGLFELTRKRIGRSLKEVMR